MRLLHQGSTSHEFRNLSALLRENGNMAKFEINWLEDRSDEAVLEEIRRVAALNPSGRLTRDTFDSHAKIKSSAVERRFGSWSEATRRAGLNDALPVYSDAAIIADLKRVSDSTESVPFTIATYRTRGRYSPSYIKRRFGGWRQALEAAGIGSRFGGPPTTDRMKSQPGRTRTNEQILGEIRDIFGRLGKASLTGADIEANSEITQSQLFRRFGSVAAALKHAGIEPVRRRYTEDDMFENLLEVWTHYGRPPAVSEMRRSPSKVGPDVYIHRYGQWRKALKAFVEHTNSEVDRSLAVDPGQDHSTHVDQTGHTGSPETSTASKERPEPAIQIIERPHPPRLTSTEVKPPEDRREPSIGLRFKVLQRDRFKCVLCGDHPALNAQCVLHVDHVIPWSKGGKTRKDNLRTLCATCNIGRGNRFDS